MTDDQRSLVYLAESVRHSISSIEKGIKNYVFHEDGSAYRIVVIELRKLLVDKDAVASFRRSIRRAKSANSVFELQYGNGKNIMLKSFSRRIESSEYVDITPNVYSDRRDILYSATCAGNLVPLGEWLDEYLAYSRNGEILKVGTAIKYIAGKEGSHIINPVRDKREDIGITFFSSEPTPDQLERQDFNATDPWRQFAIDAGMRLLSATTKAGDRLSDIKRLIGSWGRDKMKAEKAWLQSIVWSLMQTLLEDHPTLLSHTERSNLMDADYCKDALGLKLSNLPLLRHLGDGIVINGHPRYWAPRCGDYYVCSQWWKAHHRHNAEMLQRFVDSLISRNRDDPGVPALNRHRVVLEKASLRQSTP